MDCEVIDFIGHLADSDEADSDGDYLRPELSYLPLTKNLHHYFVGLMVLMKHSESSYLCETLFNC